MLQGNIHLNIKHVQRNKGQCLVARVAYATGSSIYDPRTGQTHNYRWKKSEIGMTILITRQGETNNHGEYAAFWGVVEKHHKRKDAVPGRTISIALPREFSISENKQLMLQYGRWLCENFGVGVQIAAHKPGSHNPHFHVALTACEVFADGTFGKKVTALDPICAQHNKEALSPVEILRATWADMVNTAYAKVGAVETLDHRSYLRRAVDKPPQRHEGIWQHLPCPVDCPAAYNETLQTINEVLHDYGQSIHGVTSEGHGFGENALQRMERNSGGAAQYFTPSERIDDASEHPLEGSPLSHGGFGRSDFWIGSGNPCGNAQPQNGNGHIVENQQAAELAEYAFDHYGGESLFHQESLIDIMTAPLAHAVETLELELLGTKRKMLRVEAFALPVVPVVREGLLDMMGRPFARLTQALELGAMRINKQVLTIQLQHTPVILPENKSIIQIIQPHLEKTVNALSYNSCSFEEKMNSFCKKMEREAGRDIALMPSGSASPPSLETNREPSWDERLWWHIVARAKQIPDKSDLAKTVYLACSQVWTEDPKLELNHFAYTLKQHSIRSDAEKEKILGALQIFIAGKLQKSKSPQPAAISATTPATEAEHRETAPPLHNSAEPQAEQMNGPIPPKPHVISEASAPTTVTTTVIPLIPAQSKTELSVAETDPAQTIPQRSSPPSVPRARPSLFSAKPIYNDQRGQVRKAFERVLQAQNLPHDTLQEKKTQILTAAIALWQHNPQLKFAQVERVLRYYLEFTMANAAALAEVLKLHEPMPQEQMSQDNSAVGDTGTSRESAQEKEVNERDGVNDGMHM